MTSRVRWAAAAVVVLATALAGCTQPPPAAGTASGAAPCPGGVQTPNTPTITKISYGPQPWHLADFYPACGTRIVGTIMYIHGGGYSEGGRWEATTSQVMRLRSNGWAVVSIDYTLSPIGLWPTQPNEVESAITWWRNVEAPHLGIGPLPLVGMGWSAGGQLAEWVGVQDSGPTFDATVSVSGATYWPDRVGQSVVTTLFGLNPPMWLLEQASTTTQLDPADPPLLHIHADNDPLVYATQADRLQAAITAHGNPARHTVLRDPSCGHSIACMTPERIDPFLAGIAS